MSKTRGEGRAANEKYSTIIDTQRSARAKAQRDEEKEWAVKASPVETRQRKICYIAGPVSGHPEVPLPEKIGRFYATQTELEERGFTVVNPLEIKPDCDMSCNAEGHIGQDGVPTHSWACFMKYDLKALLECDHIAILPGWAGSRGAELEMRIAQALGMTEIPIGFDGRLIAEPQNTNTATSRENANG